MKRVSIIQSLAARTWVSLAGLAVVAFAFRSYKLGALPPGLSNGETSLLSRLTSSQAWSPEATIAPLFGGLMWLWTRAVGLDVGLLRLLPALLGTLAVVVTWLWLRSWFGVRVAWLAALLMAASPWALTLSRNLSAAALVMIVLPLLLWTSTMAFRHGGAGRWIAAASAGLVALASGPAGWLALAITGTCGLIGAGTRPAQPGSSPHGHRRQIISLALTVLPVLALASLMFAPVRPALALPPVVFTGVTDSITRAVAALGMFHVAGDSSYVHNLGGAPLLNIFTGLMLVAGLIFAATRLRSHRYARLLAVLVIGLVPVIVAPGSTPNAAWAVMALPAVMAIAALGTTYLLSVWLSTFPANAAARLAGRSAVGLLLVLSSVQGFTQYFHAWGGSPETYSAYQSSAVEAAAYASRPAAGTRDIVVSTPEEQPVINLLGGNRTATLITPDQLAAGVASGKLRFIITPAAIKAATPKLQDSFAGARLVPHTSSVTGSELLYTYEVTK